MHTTRQEEEAGAGQDPIALDLLDREKAAFERLAAAMAVVLLNPHLPNPTWPCHTEDYNFDWLFDPEVENS
jgi:hypothetical protein